MSTGMWPIMFTHGVFSLLNGAILIGGQYASILRTIMAFHDRILLYVDVLMLVPFVEWYVVIRHISQALCRVYFVLTNTSKHLQIIRMFIKPSINVHIPYLYCMLLDVIWSMLHERSLVHRERVLPQKVYGILLHNRVGLQTRQRGPMQVVKGVLPIFGVVILNLTSDLFVDVNALEDTDIHGLTISFADQFVLNRHVFFRIQGIMWVLDRGDLWLLFGLYYVDKGIFRKRVVAWLSVFLVVESVHVLSQKLFCSVSFSILRILDGLNIILFITLSQTLGSNVKICSCLILVENVFLWDVFVEAIRTSRILFLLSLTNSHGLELITLVIWRVWEIANLFIKCDHGNAVSLFLRFVVF